MLELLGRCNQPLFAQILSTHLHPVKQVPLSQLKLFVKTQLRQLSDYEKGMNRLEPKVWTRFLAKALAQSQGQLGWRTNVSKLYFHRVPS